MRSSRRRSRPAWSLEGQNWTAKSVMTAGGPVKDLPSLHATYGACGRPGRVRRRAATGGPPDPATLFPGGTSACYTVPELTSEDTTHEAKHRADPDHARREPVPARRARAH